MTLPTTTGEFRVGTDPELRFTPSGLAVCKFRAVASSRKKNDKDEWVDDKTCWLNVVGFKQVAENMAETFEKGNLVTIIGRLSTDDWEDDQGNKRTALNLMVDSIGPAVTWDAAKVVKVERSSGGSRPPAEDPWAVPDTPTGQGEEPPF